MKMTPSGMRMLRELLATLAAGEGTESARCYAIAAGDDLRQMAELDEAVERGEAIGGRTRISWVREITGSGAAPLDRNNQLDRTARRRAGSLRIVGQPAPVGREE